jgi:dienelactone hydrolase
MQTEVLFNSPQVNPSRLTVWGDDSYAAQAIEYEVGSTQRVYFSQEAALLHGAIDAALPGATNNILRQSLDHQVMTISSERENVPDTYYLLNRRTNRLMPLGARHPGFPATETNVGEEFSFVARDGLTISGRVVYPRNQSGPVPLIVITPFWLNGSRTSAEFDRRKQSLVAAGYAVAEINWRGTIGFGRSFSEAGDFQIESGLPNDLEDGTRWLIAQGKIDPKRVALLTRNWGGFPAIRTLARPDLFSAWINFDTRLDYRSLNNEALALSRLDEREVIQARGGRKALDAYKRTLDIQPLIATLKQPQFHYYGDTQYNSISLLKSAQKKSNAVAVFHYFASSSYASELEKQNMMLYDEIFAFLHQYLPTGTAP